MPSTPTLNSDGALLARLDALRTSSVTLSETESPLPIPKKVETPESILSSRLKALRTASESSTASAPRPSSPPPIPAPISPPSPVKSVSHGPEEGPPLDDMGRPRGPPNESLEHGPIRPSMPATRNSANAIFREGRRQAQALEESIKSANFKFGGEGDMRLLKMDAAKVAQDAGKAVAKEEDEKRGHERRVEVWKEEDRVRGEKREKRLKDDATKAIEKAKRTLAAKKAGAPTSEDDHDDDESGADTDESDAARQRRRRLTELESEDEHADPQRDEDAEAAAILAEMMDDVGLDFEEDARKGLFQQDAPPKLSPPPALVNPITSRENKADPGMEFDERNEDEFHKAMKARMTALRSPSPKPPPGDLELPGPPSTEPVDSLGLPSAPTSHVEVKGTGAQAPKEEYICKVCYAPATVFCEGCEEDFEEWDTKEDAMFCARCWKEVHLGENAGDERKHEWAPVRRGK